MPVVSRKLTTRGESYPRFLERNERKEIRMALTLKKKDKEKESKKEVAEKPAKGARAKNVPVPLEDRDGDRYGMTWGLRMNETFIRLLAENEDPKKGHKDDEQLIAFLVKEFPNRHNKAIFYNPREIRWRYNFGKLFQDKDGTPHPPEVQSQKYDEDGNVYEKKANMKTGMSEAERAMKLEDRKKVEATRREEEDAKILKSEERHQKLVENIEARRANWENKNGPLQENQPAKKKLKKA